MCLVFEIEKKNYFREEKPKSGVILKKISETIEVIRNCFLDWKCIRTTVLNLLSIFVRVVIFGQSAIFLLGS